MKVSTSAAMGRELTIRSDDDRVIVFLVPMTVTATGIPGFEYDVHRPNACARWKPANMDTCRSPCWGGHDPAGQGVESVRVIREDIRGCIEQLIREFDAAS